MANAREQHQLETTFSCGRPEVVPLKRLVADKFADVLPALQDAEYEQLKESIELHGITDPLKVIESGAKKGDLIIVDGHNRARAAKELEKINVPVVIMTMADGDEARIFVLLQQLGRRNLTAAQRDECLAALCNLQDEAEGAEEESCPAAGQKPTPKKKTIREVAKQTGTSKSTVHRAVKRQGFIEQHPEYKPDAGTDFILKLEKALKKIRPKDDAELLLRKAQGAAKAAGWSRMSAKDVATAVKLMLRCDFGVDAALRTVTTEGGADRALQSQSIIDELEDPQDRAELFAAVAAGEREFEPDDYRAVVSLMHLGYDVGEAIEALVAGKAMALLEAPTEVTPPVTAGGEQVQAPLADFSTQKNLVAEVRAENAALNEEKDRLGEAIVMMLSYADSQGEAMSESPWSDASGIYETVFGQEPELVEMAS